MQNDTIKADQAKGKDDDEADEDGLDSTTSGEKGDDKSADKSGKKDEKPFDYQLARALDLIRGVHVFEAKKGRGLAGRMRPPCRICAPAEDQETFLARYPRKVKIGAVAALLACWCCPFLFLGGPENPGMRTKPERMSIPVAVTGADTAGGRQQAQ